VRELYCPACDIQLRGNFETRGAGPLARLSSDQLAFLRLFVTSRGNLSDIERTLGVSYPTVRSKLDDLIGAMEDPELSAPAPQRPRASVPPASPPSAPTAASTPNAPTMPIPTVAAPAADTAQLSRREILARIADGRLSPQEGFSVLKQTPSDET
jgi:hypothetical protein